MVIDIKYPDMWSDYLCDWIEQKRPPIIHFIRSDTTELVATEFAKRFEKGLLGLLRHKICIEKKPRISRVVFETKRKEVKDIVEEFSKKIESLDCPKIDVFYEDITGCGEVEVMPDRISNLVLNFLRLPNRELKTTERKIRGNCDDKVEIY